MSILDNDRQILRELRRIVFILDWVFAIQDFELLQLKGDEFMAINGVQAGATGTFQIGFVPPNGVPLQSGPAVSVDDPNVTLGPVGTPAANQFTAAVAASDTGTSFNLTITGTNVAFRYAEFNVPILPAAPLQITDFSLDQIS